MTIDPNQASNVDAPLTFEYAMTPQQRRLWAACATPTSRYNAAFRVEIAGKLTPELLRKAVIRIVQRHEALRSSCQATSNGPVIVVHDAASPALYHGVFEYLHETDLSGVGEADKERHVERISTSESRFMFDLLKPNAYRFHLLRLRDELFILTMTFHQIFIDGWSTELIIKEMAQQYAALAAGQEYELPVPSLQPADHAGWLNARLADPTVIDEARHLLGDFKDYRRFDVLTDRDASPRSDASHIVTHAVSPDIAVALADTSKATGRTAFVIAATACVAALHRLTGRMDVTIGAPMSGRNTPEIEPIIGTTVDTILLRVPVLPNSALSEIHDRVALLTADALARPALPLEFLCDLARERGDAIPEPAYSVGLLCQQAFGGNTGAMTTFYGCTLRTLPSISSGPLHDLFFFVVQRETGWRASLEYRSDKFSESEAQYFLDVFYRMFVATIRAPATRLADVSIPPVSSDVVSLADCAASKPSDDEDTFLVPASACQSRFFRLAQLLPDSAAFNLPACMDVKGPLNVAALGRSLRTLAERHEALRTGFCETDGVVYQRVQNEPSLELNVRILSDASIEDVAREMAVEGRRPFAGLQKPPVRALLLQLTAEHNILILTAHHIVADAHSLGLLERDVWAAYAQFAAGSEATADVPAIQYVDYAAAQNAWLSETAASAHRAFWLENLKGPLPIADIPMDREPIPGRRGETAVAIQAIPEKVLQRLQAFCASQGLTAYQVTAAAFTAFVADISGCRDILFGSPVANRSEDTQGVVGPFSGILPVRTNLTGCSTLQDVLQRSCETSVECFEHAQYPFDLLLEDLEAPSRKGRTPLFQLFFVYQNAYVVDVTAGDVVVAPCKPVGIDAPHELKFGLIKRPLGLELHVEYQRQLFADATVSRYMERFLQLLSDIVDGNTDHKIRFNRTPQLAETAPAKATAQTTEAARSPTEQFMVEQFCSVLRQPDVCRTSNFFDCGGQSIGAVRLFHAINQRYGLSLAISSLLQNPTPETLASTVEDMQMGRVRELSGGPAYRFLVPIRENSGTTHLPLYICAGAGGNVLNLRDLAGAMSAHVPIVGLQARGLKEGEEPHASFEEMARDFLEEVRRYQPKGPYFFGGYSAGGVAAYEMAQQLTAVGQHVGLVVLFDTIPPSNPRLSFADKLKWRANGFQQKGVSLIVDTGTSRLWRDLERLKKAIGKSPRTAAECQLEAAISQCYQSYALKPYRGRVLLLRPPLQVDCTLDDGRAVASDGTVVRLDNYWTDYATDLAIDVVSGGNHFNYLEGPNAVAVATSILRYLQPQLGDLQRTENEMI